MKINVAAELDRLCDEEVIMKVAANKRCQYRAMPEDVRAMLDLFPNLHFSTSTSGDYFDVLTEDSAEYVFCQPFPGPRENKAGETVIVTTRMNKARFVSWVRSGMPSGYDNYETLWEKEDYDGWE